MPFNEATGEQAVFKFGGFHFKPCRHFHYGEVDKQLEGDSRPWKTDAAYQFRNMSSDPKMQPLAGTDLNARFYAAAKGATADIFLCVENGGLYVPGNTELFRYQEPTERELRIAENKALKEYGHVISEAIQEGVAHGGVLCTLEILDARFGREKTDKLLATVALTSLKGDGRISGDGVAWANAVVGDADSLKTIPVSAHPARFDNLLMYAANRDTTAAARPAPVAAEPAPQPEKTVAGNRKPTARKESSFIGRLNENKERVARDKAAAKDGSVQNSKRRKPGVDIDG